MKSKWGKRIGYGIGDLGCNLVFSIMSSYLLIFYTDVFGIAAAAAGTMMLVTKLVDAVTDTVMGVIVDKTHTKWGQGRPYFVVGAVPFAVFTVLTFIVPDLSGSGKLIWAYVTYCLLCTAYTVVNIPLNTIPHGTKDSLELIRRTGVAVMTYPDGIQWGGEVVRLVIGIASRGEEHLEFLKRIVEMVKSAEDTDALVANATEEELYRQLNGLI